MISLAFILAAAFAATASPGPATLGIASTAMRRGAKPALAFAFGVTCGSLTWSIAAAAGLGAVMLTHGWMLELVRYAGALYLLWLGVKAAQAAWRPGSAPEPLPAQGDQNRVFAKGLFLHLTNPKAILFFGALYSMMLTPEAMLTDIVIVITAVGLQSALVFHSYALLFSRGAVMRGYLRARRPFEAAFAVLFVGAGARLLTLRLTQ